MTNPDYPNWAEPWEFGPYRYFWTGLKGDAAHDLLNGQWLAWGVGTKRPPYLYVNVPGFVGGVYYPGHVFNLTSRFNRLINHETSPQQIELWIQEGMGYLMEMMDHFKDDDGVTMGPKGWMFPLKDGQWV